VTGSAEAGLSFCHADGTPYGAPPSASLVLVLVQSLAFQALRGLGFGERDVRAALARALEVTEPSAELEPVLRRCLALLSERACR
jgi:Holliday junction resolvasome RuvABC DNA-binding subunit